MNREGYPRPFFVDGCHGNTEMHMPAKFHLIAFHGSQVREEKKSFLVKKCLRPFLFIVVMETLKYTCILSFTSMHFMVCKFEK